MSKEKMRELITKLNMATEAYDKGHPIMSDKEWDDLYFQLLHLERESGFAFQDSPTYSVYYTKVSALNKRTHNHPMLSLDKVKDTIEPLKAKFDGYDFLAMCKMDGLTCTLEYENGWLISAETRGNGIEGEDVLHNAIIIPSIPTHITYRKPLIVDGEIICRYADFEEFAEDYANPRNFAAGSIRLLDSHECACRKLTFVAWDVIEGFSELTTLSQKFAELEKLDFTVVPRIQSTVVDDAVLSVIKRAAENYSYPIDGVVFKFNDIAYGQSLGKTEHHFNNALAYKFYDETYETKLTDIEWSLGRTGVLTPIAIFDAVDTGDSTIERASLHNVSVLKDTLHGMGWAGQKIQVAKMNMIIPQVVEAEEGEGNFVIPDVCPVCSKPLSIVESEAGIEQLVCTNAECPGKLANHIDHFCAKQGMDIKGLSKRTIEKLMDWGYVNSLIDIFKLREHRKEWVRQEGFGPTSVDKILDAIDAACRDVELSKFLAAIGIPLVGTATAKILATTWEDFRNKVTNEFAWSSINSIGPEIENAINSYDYSEIDKIVANYITFAADDIDNLNSLDGKTFCITGRLEHFKNRDELVSTIGKLGGKVTGSVSSRTTALINNDTESGTSKNATAKKLNIPILSEKDFIEKYLT